MKNIYQILTALIIFAPATSFAKDIAFCLGRDMITTEDFPFSIPARAGDFLYEKKSANFRFLVSTHGTTSGFTSIMELQIIRISDNVSAFLEWTAFGLTGDPNLRMCNGADRCDSTNIIAALDCNFDQ